MYTCICTDICVFFVCVKGQKTYSSSDGYLPICVYIYIHIWLHMYISIKYTYLCIYHVSTYLRCRPDTLIVCCNFDICLFDASASLCMGSLRVGSAKTSNWWFFMFGLVDKWTYTNLTSSSFSVEFCLYATSRQVFWLMRGLDPSLVFQFFSPCKAEGFLSQMPGRRSSQSQPCSKGVFQSVSRTTMETIR